MGEAYIPEIEMIAKGGNLPKNEIISSQDSHKEANSLETGFGWVQYPEDVIQQLDKRSNAVPW